MLRQARSLAIPFLAALLVCGAWMTQQSTALTATQLVGGDEGAGDPNTGEPAPVRWECKNECDTAGCQNVASCAWDGSNCVMVTNEFSGVCHVKKNGPLEECKTKPANGFCRVYYSNPCDQERPSCTRNISGCGSKTRCE